ncbi:MAG: type II secretion system F family protein [Candidatus Pacebacteria bacterium]|nr:type II secretion system F family protein [Candidatus Paceibacterota bacterium]
MRFLYTATTKSGKKVRADIQAASRQLAIDTLKEKNLTLTALTRIESGRQIYLGGVTSLQKIIFTKHLAIMLKVGIGLSESLATLMIQSKGKLHDVLSDMRKNVESGMSFADALSKHKNVFNEFYIGLVRAGEESGNLADDLEQLANRYSKDYDLRQKVKSALLYPGVVLALTIALMMAISIFVLPKLTLLFKSLRYTLPWYTQVMLSVSQFLSNYGIQAALGFIALVVLIVWLLRQKFSAPFRDRLYLDLPVVGGIVRTINLARFSLILGSLLKSGLPIKEAVTITGNVLGNVIYQRALLDALPRINAGEPLSSILEESNLFPPFATRILVVGEETGRLTDMLLYLSEFYEHELDATLKDLSTVLEPVLLIAIGIIVLGIALSIVTPIYNFIGSVS